MRSLRRGCRQGFFFWGEEKRRWGKARYGKSWREKKGLLAKVDETLLLHWKESKGDGEVFPQKTVRRGFEVQ